MGVVTRVLAVHGKRRTTVGMALLLQAASALRVTRFGMGCSFLGTETRMIAGHLTPREASPFTFCHQEFPTQR